jgi:hypothetical protein
MASKAIATKRGRQRRKGFTKKPKISRRAMRKAERRSKARTRATGDASRVRERQSVERELGITRGSGK